MSNTPLTAEAALSIELTLAEFRDVLETMRRQRDALERALVGHNHVVRTSAGLYLKRDGVNFRPVGITRCARWYPEDARALAAGVRNGYGDRAQAVPLRVALDEEIVAMRGLIEDIESRLQAAA